MLNRTPLAMLNRTPLAVLDVGAKDPGAKFKPHRAEGRAAPPLGVEAQPLALSRPTKPRLASPWRQAERRRAVWMARARCGLRDPWTPRHPRTE
eukprot:6547312-Prymnesium_polylepis.2